MRSEKSNHQRLVNLIDGFRNPQTFKVKKPSLWWRLFGRKRFKTVIRVEPIFAPMAQDFDETEFLSKESESVFFKELKP